MSEHVVPKFRVGDVIARPTPDTHQDVKGWHTLLARRVRQGRVRDIGTLELAA